MLAIYIIIYYLNVQTNIKKMTNNKFKFLIAIASLYSTAAIASPQALPINANNEETKPVEQDIENADSAVQETKKDELGELVEKVEDEPSKEVALEKEDNKAEEAEAEVKEEKNEVTSQENSSNKVESDKVSVANFINSKGEISVEGIKLSQNLLAEVYSKRDFKTIFFDGKTPNVLFTKAKDFIALADENGLSRNTFNIRLLEKRVEENKLSETSIAKTDALITHLVVEMIKQIGNGNKITDDLKIQTYFQKPRPVRVKSGVKVFEEFLETSDVQALINKYSPTHPQYILLKKNLKNYMEKAANTRNMNPIEFNRDIVPGDRDASVSEIRKRIGGRTPISPSFKPDVYDKILVDKVKEYQKKFGLNQNGVITKEFIDNINSYDDEQVSRIKTNMERYRWLPDNIEDVRLEVNMPEFKLHAYEDGKKTFSMGAIVGRTDKKTPIMNTEMFRFVLNPYWYVPKSYAIRNILPLLRQLPEYTKLQNMKILRLEREGWKEVKQSEINWDNYNADNFPFLLRQEPGNINVLGPIKLAIVNPYDIFLHSTSEPWLFTNEYKGYSSGCIRVEDPTKLANFVIEHGKADLTPEKFLEFYHFYDSKDGVPMKVDASMSNKYFNLKQPIPIYLTYITAFAKEDGTVEFTEDTYSLDFNQAKQLKM
jgi:murein L,D-transpeptidase YcbB/YkuD